MQLSELTSCDTLVRLLHLSMAPLSQSEIQQATSLLMLVLLVSVSILLLQQSTSRQLVLLHLSLSPSQLQTTPDDLVSGKTISKHRPTSLQLQFQPLTTSVMSLHLTHFSTRATLQLVLHSHSRNQLLLQSLSIPAHTNSLTVSKTMLVTSPNDSTQVFLLHVSHQPISQQFLVQHRVLSHLSLPTLLLSSHVLLQQLVSDNSDMV